MVGHVIKSNEAGPMVVHCNDGGGRSGVYLAIDANIELAEEEDKFDVYGYLKKLRQSRKGLVENLVRKLVFKTCSLLKWKFAHAPFLLFSKNVINSK